MTPDINTLAQQVLILSATVTSLQAQVATFQADLQTATLTMESSYNALLQQVQLLSNQLTQYFATRN